MAKITVHLVNLNMNISCSHIEVALAHNGLYYCINRWEYPQENFSKYYPSILTSPPFFSSKYSFEIEANPDEICARWEEYYYKVLSKGNLITGNCADAVEWFLSEFANIPKSTYKSLPISLNHFAFCIMIPSFIPIGITLPGRVMDSAKFHVEARTNYRTHMSWFKLLLLMRMIVSSFGVISSFYFFARPINYFSNKKFGRLAFSYLTLSISLIGLFKSVNTLQIMQTRARSEKSKTDDISAEFFKMV